MSEVENPRLYQRALAMLLMPLVVVIIVPWVLRASFTSIDTSWADLPALAWVGRILGVILFSGGLSIFFWCVSLFVSVGRGTLAPWDPTRKLVSVGPYDHVRNPMISSQILFLLCEALFLGSSVVAIWALVIFFINHFYFIYSEEPGLEKRFGESYREYKRQVPRWIPRL
jgi:protein-S-isoprenylcysteine O-methyltransferase Ste14